MDTILAVIGFVVFIILSNLADKKKPKAKRIPPVDTQGGDSAPADRPVEAGGRRAGRRQEELPTNAPTEQHRGNSRVVFKIPEIVGAPREKKPAEAEVYREVDAAEEMRRERLKQAEEAAKKAERMRREQERLAEEKEKAAAAALAESRAPRRQSVQRRRETAFTSESLRQAVIFSEILGKPKPLQRRRRF